MRFLIILAVRWTVFQKTHTFFVYIRITSASSRNLKIQRLARKYIPVIYDKTQERNSCVFHDQYEKIVFLFPTVWEL